jgi:hypothetical protein
MNGLRGSQRKRGRDQPLVRLLAQRPALPAAPRQPHQSRPGQQPEPRLTTPKRPSATPGSPSARARSGSGPSTRCSPRRGTSPRPPTAATGAATRPPNVGNIADTVSEGWEFEGTFNPTPNWRITFNAAMQEAYRANVGADFAEFVERNFPLWKDGNGRGRHQHPRPWRASRTSPTSTVRHGRSSAISRSTTCTCPT